MVVALFHCFFLVRSGPVVHFILNSLANGRAAVTVFFVLSGFVLGFSLRREKAMHPALAARYVGRRLRRIVPAFAVAVTASWLLLRFMPDAWHREGAIWLNTLYPNGRSLSDLWMNLSFASSSLNGVTWALRCELFGSGFLLLCLIADRRGRGWLLALSLIAVSVAVFRPQNSTLVVFLPFLVGYSLPLIMRWCGGPPRVHAVWRLICYLFGFILVAVPRNCFVHEPWTVLCESLGSSLLITAAAFLTDEGQHIPPAWLRAIGRWSYSYYLFHPIVLFWGVAFWSVTPAASYLEKIGIGGAIAVWLLSSLITFAVAGVSYRWIELPLMERPKRTEINAVPE